MWIHITLDTEKKNTSALDMLTSFSENTTTYLSNKEICLFKMCFDSTSISSLSHLLNTPKVLLRELPLATRFTKQVFFFFEVPGLGMSPRALCMLAGQVLYHWAASLAHEACVYLTPLHLGLLHFGSSSLCSLLFAPLHKIRGCWNYETIGRGGGGSGNTG